MKPEIKVRPNSVAVLGFHDGNAGQVETWFEEVTGYHIACFVHEASKWEEIDVASENKNRVSQRMHYPVRQSFKGRPFLVGLDWLQDLKKRGIHRVLPLTSNNRERFQQIVRCLKEGMELVSAIHPTVTILAGATIAPGVWINARSLIGYEAEIEAGVLINSGVVIEHHNVLNQACQVDPGVVTAGNVTLRERCHVHTGACVIPRKIVGADAEVGAGAVVIDDVPPGLTVAGVPARVITTSGGRAPT